MTVPDMPAFLARRDIFTKGGGLVTSPQLSRVVRQPGVPNLDSDLVQPDPNVLEAVPSVEQRLDIRPCLPDLPRLRTRFFPESRSEAVQVQFVL